MKTIRQKVIAAVAVVLLLCVGAASAGLWVANTLAEALQRSNASAALLRSHMEADMMHDALRADVYGILESHDPAMHISLEEARKDLARHQQDFREAIQRSSALARTPQVRQVLAALDAPLKAYIDAASQIAELEARDPPAALARLPDFISRFEALEGAMGKASDVIEGVANADAAAAQRGEHFGRLLMGALVAASVAFGLGLVVFALRTIVDPVRDLARDMRELAAGRTDVALKGAARRDEVGDIGRAVRAFQEIVVQRAAEAAEVAQRRRDEEAAAEARLQADRLARARSQEEVVDRLAEGLGQLSAGHLDFRIREPFEGDYDRLRADFNKAMEEMEGTLRTILEAAEGIRTGAQEISAASADLSRRTEQQAANLEETAAALDEMTATVKQSADGASRANTLVGAAKTSADGSSVVVGEAVEAMGAIERSSREIGNIIGVIDEIAFQTNLLALNAGVEAARAGEAGKGFAVVASEVRGLAQRSAEAAKEIKALISGSSQQVEQGVDLVSRTGEALRAIMTQVTEVHTLVEGISSSSREQAVGLSQVNSAVNQMDQMTQQNAAMVEQSAAATGQLNQQVDQLFGLVARFRLSGGAVSARAA